MHKENLYHYHCSGGYSREIERRRTGNKQHKAFYLGLVQPWKGRKT